MFRIHACQDLLLMLSRWKRGGAVTHVRFQLYRGGLRDIIDTCRQLVGQGGNLSEYWSLCVPVISRDAVSSASRNRDCCRRSPPSRTDIAGSCHYSGLGSSPAGGCRERLRTLRFSA